MKRVPLRRTIPVQNFVENPPKIIKGFQEREVRYHPCSLPGIKSPSKGLRGITGISRGIALRAVRLPFPLSSASEAKGNYSFTINEAQVST